MVIKIGKLTSPVSSAGDQIELDNQCMVGFLRFLVKNKEC